MQNDIKIAFGSDRAGYILKYDIIESLKEKGYKNILDVGCDSVDEGFYAPMAKKVADLVVSKDSDCGILVCGTGQGMAMAANKVKGARAALVYDIFPAVLSREHNNSNILCTGAWMIDKSIAVKMIEAWLMAKYNGHYDEGMALIEQYENQK